MRRLPPISLTRTLTCTHNTLAPTHTHDDRTVSPHALSHVHALMHPHTPHAFARTHTHRHVHLPIHATAYLAQPRTHVRARRYKHIRLPVTSCTVVVLTLSSCVTSHSSQSVTMSPRGCLATPESYLSKTHVRHQVLSFLPSRSLLSLGSARCQNCAPRDAAEHCPND